MHRDDLMKSDRLSEVLLLGCGLLIMAVLVLLIVAACAGHAAAPS